MTERKSTEIKIRVTPSEKARWQTYAERSGVSLSEWMCNKLNFGTDLFVQPVHEEIPGARKSARWIPDKSHPERRIEPCSHSRPPYAFCAECDR